MQKLAERGTSVGPVTVRPESGVAPPGRAGARRAREWKTIAAMVHCYCQGHHAAMAAPCAECRSLLEYARARLERCRFGSEKPTCARCPVHCYQRDRREQVRTVMRYAGPRMVWRHPFLNLGHWLDGWRAPRLAVV